MKSSSKTIIFGVIFLIVISVIAYFTLFNSSSASPINQTKNENILITKDPKTIALSQSDVPSGFVLNTDSDETSYKDEAFWDKYPDSKIIAISRNFSNGYQNTFVYQDPDTPSKIKTIHTSISLYSLAGVKEVFNEDLQESNNGSVSFDVQKIGENSVGFCWLDSNAFFTKSYCQVSFYKNNVYAKVIVGQSGTVNVQSDSLKYAQIVEKKI